MNPLVPLDTGKAYLNRRKWEEEWLNHNDQSLLSFGTADMDFKTPKPILDALQKVLENGHLGYQFIPDEYYEAIEKWLIRKSGWKIDAKNCTSHNVGIYMSIWMILEAIASPGDEIVIQTPVHFCFRQMLIDNGLVPVENPLVEINGRYTIDFDGLEKCISERTKAVWICNPHNPVGRAWTRDELEKVGDICLRHGVIIISDDVYCDLLYKGTKYTPIASISKEISNITITCYSTSKSYNTTGLRYSFVVCENSDLLSRYIEVLQRLDMTYGINTFGIVSTIAAFNDCSDWLESLMAKVESNHELLKRIVEENIQGAVVSKADSTYFAWIDLRCLGLSSEELEEGLLEDAHLVVENGTHLGTGGEGFIRMNICCEEPTLLCGLERLVKFSSEHRR